MQESFERNTAVFRRPDIMAEQGEFERVARTFSLNTEKLLQMAEKNGGMQKLDQDTWERLENTDSNTLATGDWDEVHRHSASLEVPRDWGALRALYQTGTPIDAPIIMKYGESYHLVSGNTRLMVARASGILPDVFIFEVDTDEVPT